VGALVTPISAPACSSLPTSLCTPGDGRYQAQPDLGWLVVLGRLADDKQRCVVANNCLNL
jgi:hypothetical protein